MPHNIAPSSAESLPLPLLKKPAPSLLDPLALITPERNLRTLSRAQIGGLISQGHVLIMHRQLVYRMNRWLGQHPGGTIVVLHYVGRDATDEIEATHPLSALLQMKHFVCARVDPAEWKPDSDPTSTGWKPFVPPLHLGWSGDAADYAKVPSIDTTLADLARFEEVGYPTSCPAPTLTQPAMSRADLEPPPPPADIDPLRQQQLSVSFRKLRHEMLQDADLFRPDPLRLYAPHIVRISALIAVFLASWYWATARWHLAVSAISLGFAMHQAMFVAHDAGHMNLTGSRFIDYGIGGFLASFCSGLSLGWWVSQHDVHHQVCNHPEHDPDIQLLPFFAFSTKCFTSVFSTFHSCIMEYDAAARFLVPFQHVYFYPVMVFARFSLIGKSVYYLLFKAKPDSWRTYETVGMLTYWAWFGALLMHMGDGLDGLINAVGFTLLMLCAVAPIHVQIVLSHSAQDSIDKGVYECFVARQFRTTMDVACPENLEWIHGGLHRQLTHHLMSRLPRPNLGKATVRVKAWAKENDLVFLEKNFTDGNAEFQGMLAELAGQARAFNAKVGEIARGEIDFD